MDELLEKIANDNDEAYGVCLLLVLENKEYVFKTLDRLNIYGQDLVTLAYKCCDPSSIDYLTQTIRFLSYPGLTKKEIFDNLHSKNPIHFVPRLMIEGEDWEETYWSFIWDFRDKIKNNNKSR